MNRRIDAGDDLHRELTTAWLEGQPVAIEGKRFHPRPAGDFEWELVAIATSPVPIWANQEDDPILSADPRIGANSYHLVWNGERQSEAELWRQARGYLGRPRGGKGAHLSNDGAFTWRALLRELVELLPRDGSWSFEHFDMPLSRRRGLAGSIRAKRDFLLDPLPGHEGNGPDRGPLRRMEVIGRAGSRLEPGGRVAIEGGRFTWNGEPVFLCGYSYFGVLNTTRHDPLVYAQVLGEHRVNLCRVWPVENWTALVRRDLRGEPGFRTALHPWEGQGPPQLGAARYDLETLRELWWRNLEEFVSECWRLGIVVVVSMFDWAGIRNRRDGAGRWLDSPFNAANNRQGHLNEVVPQNGYPRGFTDTSGPFWELMLPYVHRLARLAARHGNVILEIANEPRRADADERQWHLAIAEEIAGAAVT